MLRRNRKVYHVGRAGCLRPYRTLCCPAELMNFMSVCEHLGRCSAVDGDLRPGDTVPPMLSAASTAVLPGPENTGLPNEPIDVQLVCAAPRRLNMPRVLLELRPSPFSPNATQRWKRRSRSSPRYDPRELPGTSRLGPASARHPAQQSWASCLMKRRIRSRRARDGVLGRNRIGRGATFARNARRDVGRAYSSRRVFLGDQGLRKKQDAIAMVRSRTSVAA